MTKCIRLLEPNVIFSVVQTTVDRTFSFAPNHGRAHPLLASGCSTRAFDLYNPIIPVPSVINIIGSAAARALELAPINLHALEVSSNHIHEVSSPIGDDIAALPEFWRNFHSTVARDINRLRRREGHLFAGASHVTPCSNGAQAFDQLIYALTNPVKDGLVERVSGSPFFSTYRRQVRGEELRYWDIEWERYWEAGGPHNKRINPKQFMVWRTLEITPLPELAALPEHKRQTTIRKSVEDVEAKTAEMMKREGRFFGPVSRHFEVDPRDHPLTPRKPGRKPLIHASSKTERDEYREKLRDVMAKYIPASIAFRQGLFDVEFPPGTFRPPLTKPIPIANSS